MKKRLLRTGVMMVLMALSVAIAAHSANEESTARVDSGDWEIIFNGEDFTGWRQYNGTGMPGNWEIENGTMKVFPADESRLGHGAGGDIIYAGKIYTDFELSIDWMAGDRANSGIFYYVREIPERPIFYAAPEIQILDNQNASDNKIDSHLAGSLYDMLAADPATVNPAGEWNTIVIRVKDGEVTHVQNGQKVVEYTLWSDQWDELVENSKFKNFPGFTEGIARAGYIGLQDHGYTVWFRNIKIREL